MSVVLKLAAAALTIYAVLVALVWFFQDRLIYYPQMGREIVATPASAGMRYDDLTIATEDGERLSAWWLPAPQAKGAVLLFHGNAGNISHRVEYALMFRTLGYSTLLVDYRGYGKSSGTPSEEGTYRDAEAAWRWLREVRKLREREVVIFGESLGGAVASWLAARHKPRALVLASTFTSAVDLGAEVYSFLPVRLISRFRYDTLERLPRIDAPVLVFHSPDDDIIPYHHGERLYAAAREPKAFVALQGGHNSGFVYMRAAWVQALARFLAAAELVATR